MDITIPFRLGEEWMESVLAEKDLRFLFDSQLNMSQQCAPVAMKANLIRNSEAIRSGEVMVRWDVALVTTHLGYCVHFGPLTTRRCAGSGWDANFPCSSPYSAVLCTCS